MCSIICLCMVLLFKIGAGQIINRGVEDLLRVVQNSTDMIEVPLIN